MSDSRRAPRYRCPRCAYEPSAATCEVCGDGFPSAHHKAAHKRYNHGAGLRRAPADGEPPLPEPTRATPASLAVNLRPVPVAAIALPWLRLPDDAEGCLRMRQMIVAIVEPARARGELSEREFGHWRSLVEYLRELPAARAQQREIQETATRQTIGRARVSYV